MSLFFRKPSGEARARTAIIDIGSNSIRLVVYEGPARLPATLFNEKVMAGLGRGLAETGAISTEGMATARAALARFAMLARAMEVDELRTVATAAVRDASNGADLLAIASELGLSVELLPGEAEATASGHGVLSAIPDADGIVGDLGGGSLELVRVSNGAVGERVSFPLGVLRIAAIRARGKGTLDRHVARALREANWLGRGQGLPLYLVGGSWRALARLDMHQTAYPLPVIHGYRLDAATIERLIRQIGGLPKAKLRNIPNLSGGRIATLDDAARLLTVLMRHLGSEMAIASAFGLREGLLHERLDPATRALDPLIVAAREEGRRLGRFPEHGDLLDAWIAPLFGHEDAALARLRHAACLLADVAWLANPEFRAERGLEVALHGNWVAIEAEGRALLAQALFTCFGGGTESPDPLARLAAPDRLECAARWGLAMRLGQRLSGGVAGPLKRTALARTGDRLTLRTEPAQAALYGEAVERRHKALAGALGLTPAHVPDFERV
ncbi:exopolyphosphatase [Sphingomonas spermidinifaciens]|uniref:Exopolyphosphatase n=1 Tax=Sphingomonas spermidinifaciens TaxID=1141889 RepID=A0A2A4B627_9SPHN|nr:Ppx/GppA family phosphatase [Sphingomonas spermidinifaciens]PCD03218.1 exopolyphosphatase [Sphingomonas spermidinifaciens]